jgi:hypothetical protein
VARAAENRGLVGGKAGRLQWRSPDGSIAVCPSHTSARRSCSASGIRGGVPIGLPEGGPCQYYMRPSAFQHQRELSCSLWSPADEAASPLCPGRRTCLGFGCWLPDGSGQPSSCRWSGQADGALLVYHLSPIRRSCGELTSPPLPQSAGVGVRSHLGFARSQHARSSRCGEFHSLGGTPLIQDPASHKRPPIIGRFLVGQNSSVMSLFPSWPLIHRSNRGGWSDFQLTSTDIGRPHPRI